MFWIGQSRKVAAARRAFEPAGF